MLRFLHGGIRPPRATTNTALFILRLYFGLTIAGAGLDKIPLTDWMIDQVAEIGFPYPVFFGWLASWVEFAGGLLLVLGLFTRPAAILVAFSMAVAAFAFHDLTPILDMHIAQGYVWACTAVALTGAGQWSIDRLVLPQTDIPTTTRWAWVGYAVAASLLAIGLWLEFTGAAPSG